jgi:hypothetical protein
MSSKVKERLKKLALEMTHEERLELDDLLDKMAMKMGIILVKDQSKGAEQRGCDILIERIPDDKLREIVKKIKKKKKRLIEVPTEAN